ncbi:MAG: ferredoxin [bacterium]
MKVIVDPELCTGCELCVSSSPDLFEMQEDKAVPINAEVDPSLEEECKETAQSCPVEAIKVE